MPVYGCYDLQQLLDAAGDQVQGEGLHATVRTETPVLLQYLLQFEKPLTEITKRKHIQTHVLRAEVFGNINGAA